MKRCPACRRDYTDETLNLCLDDGEWLVIDSKAATTVLRETDASGEARTRAQVQTTDRTVVLPDNNKKTSHTRDRAEAWSYPSDLSPWIVERRDFLDRKLSHKRERRRRNV